MKSESVFLQSSRVYKPKIRMNIFILFTIIINSALAGPILHEIYDRVERNGIIQTQKR